MLRSSTFTDEDLIADRNSEDLDCGLSYASEGNARLMVTRFQEKDPNSTFPVLREQVS